ncbi:hypothetical protein [Pelagibacterium sp. H642]|nr:hypothetical protein [Pelagibacterium sp. H642]WMT91174.1 hypothetical protein NO934_02630 [Pelagibacterium sp. H642]
MGRRKTGKSSGNEATQVFRQFAWNLAGTLARRPAKAAQGKPETAR